MMHSIDKQLEKIGLQLPTPPPPQGHYLPWVISGNLVFLAGQILAFGRAFATSDFVNMLQVRLGRSGAVHHLT